MQLTKGAIGNLINRYKAVLKKCHLMNTFGSLAVAGMLIMGGAGVAGATDDVPLEGKNTYDSEKTPKVNHLMGGWLVNTPETAEKAKGAITLTVKGGEISEIIGGSYAKGLTAGENSKLLTVKHGDITTAISDKTTSAEFVVGGSKVAGGAGANLETGNISLTINDGTFGKSDKPNAYELVMGGNYLKASTGDVSVNNTATAENITVNISGGKFDTSVTGGSVAHVYGSGDKKQVLSVTDASTSVTITGGTFRQSSSTGLGAIELDPSIIGGGLALVKGEKGTATSTITGNTLVTINGDVTIADKVLGGSLAQGKGATVTIGKEGGTSTSAVVVENVKSVGDLVGGNMTEGDENMGDTDVTTTLHGNSSVTVKAGKVEGDIIGGSYARNAGTVTTNGNTSVVFNAANSPTVSQAEYIVGGDKVLSNGTATGKITGTSSVTINNNASVTTGAVVGGSFSRATPGTAEATVANSVVTINGGKSIAGVVGGGLAEHLTGTGSAKSVVEGTSSVVIKGGTVTNIVYTTSSGKKASSYAAVTGAGFATGEKATASVKDSVVVIDGANTVIKGNQPDTGENGYFDKDNAKVVAGGVAINGGTVNVTNTSLTMKDGTVTGDLVGGNLIDGSGKAGNITSTSVALTGGTLDGEVMGGSYVRGTNTSEIGTTNVLVSGGTLQNVAQKAQYVLGGGKALVYAKDQQANLTIGTTNVTISDAVKVLGGGVIGGSLAKGTGTGKATVSVTKANTTILGGTKIAGVVGGGVAENYGTATGTVSSSVTESQLTISGGTSDALRYGAQISDGGETASKAAVVGGGVASAKGAGTITSSVTTANTTINGGTINGNVFAGGLADGGTATVGTANLTIKGGNIAGDVYAGGAALNSGAADVTGFDVRITGGNITGDVVAGNYTGEKETQAVALLSSSSKSTAGKGTITIGGDAKIGGKVDASAGGAATNVVIDGADAEVTGGYEGNKDSTLTFNNYNATFNNTATGFGTLSVAEGSNVQMDNLSTGAKGKDDKGFFGNNGNVDVTGKGTVTATNVNVANNTLNVADGSTLDATTLTTKDNGKAKTDGLGSTLIIGNTGADALGSIKDGSLSSTAGSEIQFTGLGNSVAASDISAKLDNNSTGIVNVGETKVKDLSDLVKDGQVDYTEWTSKTGGITNNELKKATLTGVNGDVDKIGSFGSAELAAGTMLNVGTAGGGSGNTGNLTLTGLDGSNNFVSTNGGEKADATIFKDSTLTLGDNAYAGNKGIGGITINQNATLNVLGQSAAAATVNSGAITPAAATGTTVHAKNVTLNVAGGIGDATAIGTITADAANIKANDGDIKAEDVILKNNGLLAASKKDATTGGNITISDQLSGQGSVVADKTLTLTKGYTGAADDVLTLQAGENITAAAGQNLTQAAGGKLTVVAGDTITAKDISATNVTAKKLTASGDVAVDGGTLNLTGTATAEASKVKNLTLTNGTQASIAGSLTLQDPTGTGTGTVTVGTGDDKVGGTTLSAKHINLAGGTLLVDPDWNKASSNVAVENLSAGGATDVVVNGSVGVGQNSYLALGTADTGWLPGVVGNYTKGVGLSMDGITAALGVFKGITIADTKGLVVNGSLTGTALNTAIASNTAEFAKNSLLVVNGANIYGDKAAITFMSTSGGTLTVDKTSRLVVTDAVAGQDYTIVANAATVQDGTSAPITAGGTVWKTEGLSTTTDMIS
uniref:beta strand repeat-containing protein n=1 Tax=Desulfovibrio sp. TaxID=885 RepID=UPI00307AA64B